MALKATVFRAELSVADMGRNYYNNHQLTVARHPSETDSRMLGRIVAFALNADESLQFCKGISDDSEPDLWLKDDTSAIRLWISLGQPEPSYLRKAAGRAEQVIVYCTQGNACRQWLKKNNDVLSGIDNLAIYELPAELNQLCDGLERNNDISVTIDDDMLAITVNALAENCQLLRHQ